MPRLAKGLCCLAFWAACGSTSAPVAPSQDDDGGKAAGLACEVQRGHVEALYRQAAEVEEVAENLSREFVESLTHMAMSDCLESPRNVATCLGKSRSARDIETQCLLPIDDAGESEGRRFANTAPQ